MQLLAIIIFFQLFDCANDALPPSQVKPPKSVAPNFWANELKLWVSLSGQYPAELIAKNECVVEGSPPSYMSDNLEHTG